MHCVTLSSSQPEQRLVISCTMTWFCFSHQVCTNVAQCYAVASQFEGCREKIQENTAIIRDLVRILYYKVSEAHINKMYLTQGNNHNINCPVTHITQEFC